MYINIHTQTHNSHTTQHLLQAAEGLILIPQCSAHMQQLAEHPQQKKKKSTGKVSLLNLQSIPREDKCTALFIGKKALFKTTGSVTGIHYSRHFAPVIFTQFLH